MPSVHSHYSPSASKRWLNCSGSLTATPEDWRIHEENQDTTAADRGTLGHSMVEAILDGRWEEAKAMEYDPLFDQELYDDVNYCQEWVRDNVESAYHEPNQGGYNFAGLEVRLESSLIDGFGGTMDVLRVIGKDAHIVDFKFGRELVEADQNRQLLCYALLVYEHYPEVERFTVTILQGGEAKTVVHCRTILDNFFGQVLRASLEVYWKAGDHCQYCPMRYRCTTASAFVFDESQKDVDLETVDTRPSRERIDEVVRAAKAGKLAKDIYDEASRILKAWSAEGVYLGDEAKVTQSNKRGWEPDISEPFLVGELGDDAYTKKLKSPAQVQKSLGMTDDQFQQAYGGLVKIQPTKILRLGKNPPEFG